MSFLDYAEGIRSLFLGAVQKGTFGQPHAPITLPKAPNSLFYAVFGPLAGQKLHLH
jgi:hypothetical protein